jgi:hypothetical protein
MAQIHKKENKSNKVGGEQMNQKIIARSHKINIAWIQRVYRVLRGTVILPIQLGVHV